VVYSAQCCYDCRRAPCAAQVRAEGGRTGRHGFRLRACPQRHEAPKTPQPHPRVRILRWVRRRRERRGRPGTEVARKGDVPRLAIRRTCNNRVDLSHRDRAGDAPVLVGLPHSDAFQRRPLACHGPVRRDCYRCWDSHWKPSVYPELETREHMKTCRPYISAHSATWHELAEGGRTSNARSSSSSSASPSMYLATPSLSLSVSRLSLPCMAFSNVKSTEGPVHRCAPLNHFCSRE
jgi:hypothetical protein